MAKFPSPYRNAAVRRNGWRQRNRKPSATCARRGERSTSRTSWNGVRIATNETIENAYDAASATNGTARPSPKSAPPTGGAIRRTIDARAPCVATAAGSWRSGTIARSAPGCAATKKTAPVPSTNATRAICQKDVRWSWIVATRVAIASARMTSAAIISRRRLQRSAATPARSAKSACGMSRANETTPAFAGEWVSASTSSG